MVKGYAVSNNVSLNELYYLSNGAEVLALSSAAGVAGGALATWGVYGLVSQLGVAATTGTAIGTLSGAAAHNATMAYIGGGALSIGGGVMRRLMKLMIYIHCLTKSSRRSKNVAIETGRTFQDLLGSYGMERTLYLRQNLRRIQAIRGYGLFHLL